jgi:RNA polymerase sigma factor (sigma-70 family)
MSQRKISRKSKGTGYISLTSCWFRKERGLLQLKKANNVPCPLCAPFRFHRRQRRNVNQEQAPVPQPEEDDRDTGGPADRAPGPEEAAAFADQFQQLIAGLEPEEQKVVELKLQDLSNEEIAQRLRTSERTVRRILARLRGRFERALLG